MAHTAPGVYVEEMQSGSAPIAGVGTSTPVFISIDSAADSTPTEPATNIVFYSNFSEFKTRVYPELTDDPTTPITDANRYMLLHSVFGFFQNGGTGCYVAHGNGAVGSGDLTGVLAALEAIDDIQMVLAPGIDPGSIQALTDHCAKMQDRVAILDIPDTAPLQPSAPPFGGKTSDYAAAYYPTIQVSPIANSAVDATTKKPTKPAVYFVPPCGHVAGLYARVDATRGVHKAPANELLSGALDVKVKISPGALEKEAPIGVNCIRLMGGDVRVWGARTLGGDKNSALLAGDFKYIHVRRLFNYIRSSIQRGTQWTVFEPNNAVLWAKVTRNVNAFLLLLWEQGALFGDTPAQAFYVKCDEETNPPQHRALGEMRAEIGISITQTAEFVVFQIGQWQPDATA